MIEKLDYDEHDRLRAIYVERCFRLLFDDGRTADVRAIADGSELRDAMLKFFKAERIAGVAEVPAGD